MMEKEPHLSSPESNEPKQIGQIIDEAGGAEGIVGKDLPAGRTNADQKRDSLSVEIDDLQVRREEIVKQIERGDNSPELRDQLKKITDLQVRVRAERNAVDVDPSING